MDIDPAYMAGAGFGWVLAIVLVPAIGWGSTLVGMIASFIAGLAIDHR